MTDFYAQLEQQLVNAGRRRQTQGRVRRAVAGRGRTLVAATAVAAAVGAGAAIALPAALTRTSERAPAAQQTVATRPEPAPAPAPAPPAAVPAVPGPSLAGIRVAVLNGTTRTGLARAVATTLERRKARIESVASNADQATRRTAVLYRSGSRSKALRVASVLGGVPVRASGAAPVGRAVPVIVVVGTDYPLRPAPPSAVPIPRAPLEPPPAASPVPRPAP